MNDVFGAAIRAYFRGDKQAEIQVKIDGQEDDPIPVATFFRAFESMPPLEQIAIEACRGRVLDVGAAAGCHSLVLQQRGLEAVALDNSEGCCEVMRERNILQVVEDDFFQFEDAEGFDTILLLMNGIGIAGTIEQSPRLFDKLERLLKPGGKVITDSSDLIYLYQEEDGSISIPLEKYYGEVEFDIRFLTDHQDVFPWVYIDPDLLAEITSNLNWELKIINHGEHFDYLAELSPGHKKSRK